MMKPKSAVALMDPNGTITALYKRHTHWEGKTIKPIDKRLIDSTSINYKT